MQKHGTIRYSYDSMNRLNKVQYPSATEELFYDKSGNRIKRLYNGAEELYQYDRRNRLTTYTKGGVSTQYEYDNAGNLLKDDKARYEYDAFNRNTKVETFSGNIQINRYDAWGNLTTCEEKVHNRFKFNGQQLDPVTQQYYLRARYYNPVIGRFTQEDTYRGDGLNLYAYCANNPVYYVDPSGHLICQNIANTIIDKLRNNQATRNEQKKLVAFLRAKSKHEELADEEQKALN